MKILRHQVFFFLIAFCGCTAMDTDIPAGHSSYEKGGKPEAYIDVGELSPYAVMLRMNIEDSGNRRLARLRACYSETNPLPDTTDQVVDVFSQYLPDSTDLSISLLGLEPATSYYCRLYLANPDSGNYTNSVAFTTKVPSDDSSWQKVASIPWQTEHYTCGFNIGDRYFAVASHVSSEGENRLIEYLPETDEWSMRSILPFGNRVRPIAVSSGGKGYAGLGDIKVAVGEGNQYFFQRDWWRYDPETNSWDRMADIPAATIGMMAAFSVGDKIYVVTANDYWNSTTMSVWEYDTVSDRWTRKHDFPGEKLNESASFVINGGPFVFTGSTVWLEEGGNVEDSKSEYVSDMWEYEVSTDTWYRRSDFKGGKRAGIVAAVLDGKGYAGFGFKPVTDVYLVQVVDWWVYEPDRNLWSRRNVLSEWVNFNPELAFSVKGNVYVGSFYEGIWKYVEGEK